MIKPRGEVNKSMIISGDFLILPSQKKIKQRKSHVEELHVCMFVDIYETLAKSYNVPGHNRSFI